MEGQFIYACKTGDTAKVALLIKSVDQSTNTLGIRCASRNGQTDVVRLLLEDSRADPSAKTNAAIQLACYYGHTDIVRLLLADSRVDPSTQRNCALRWACSRGHLEVVRILLDDPRVEMTSIFTIQRAKDNGCTEIVDLLTEHQFRLDGPEYNKNII